MSAPLVASALAMGFLGSGHCVGMCGGLVAMACSALPGASRGRPIAQIPYLLAYNGGRIASYAAAGAAGGAAGATLASHGSFAVGSLALRAVAGGFMVAVGLQVAGLARPLAWLEQAGERAWRRLAPAARRLVPVRSPWQALALGMLWGWMPCGLVYAALAGAVTSGSALRGAAVMAAFGVGTLPALVAMGHAAALGARLARSTWGRRAAGAAVVALGLVQIGHVGRVWPRGAGATPPCHAVR
ncbi:MAG TPA: sulfite exporter TauE/SafE family protein [Polyangiaceae bacterium]|nr:sulfite exporter TauE/SafE family protein [Polyangiaceae bacterium]